MPSVCGTEHRGAAATSFTEMSIGRLHSARLVDELRSEVGDGMKG